MEADLEIERLAFFRVCRAELKWQQNRAMPVLGCPLRALPGVVGALKRIGVPRLQETTSLFSAIPPPAFLLTPVLHGVCCATPHRKRASPVDRRPQVGHFPFAAAARLSWSFSRSSALRHGVLQNRRRPQSGEPSFFTRAVPHPFRMQTLGMARAPLRIQFGQPFPFTRERFQSLLRSFVQDQFRDLA